jgi:membrane-bound lytic murein transglycosylase D
LDFNFTVNPLVQQYINYYQDVADLRWKRACDVWSLHEGCARNFRREGVPGTSRLGRVESAWSPKRVQAAASGLWQFVSGTGAQYGLNGRPGLMNETDRKPRPLGRYLKISRRYNGNWELAMAAYNTGALNVDRAISRAGEANYWKIYPYIAQETRNYVPNILAVIMIAKNPEKYGFHGIRPEAPVSFESVAVPSATSLRLIADASDTSVDYLQALNPKYRDTTPAARRTTRVPSGKERTQCPAEAVRRPSRGGELFQLRPAACNRANRGRQRRHLQTMNAGVDFKSATKLVIPNNTVRLTNRRRDP